MLSRFSSCHSNTRYKLFGTYCTSYYGCPLWNLECTDINKLYVAWRNN